MYGEEIVTEVWWFALLHRINMNFEIFIVLKQLYENNVSLYEFTDRKIFRLVINEMSYVQKIKTLTNFYDNFIFYHK